MVPAGRGLVMRVPRSSFRSVCAHTRSAQSGAGPACSRHHANRHCAARAVVVCDQVLTALHGPVLFPCSFRALGCPFCLEDRVLRDARAKRAEGPACRISVRSRSHAPASDASLASFVHGPPAPPPGNLLRKRPGRSERCTDDSGGHRRLAPCSMRHAPCSMRHAP